MTRVVDPVIADWQAEYAEAGQQRVWRRRWVRWSGYVVLLKALAAYGCWQLSVSGRRWPEEDRRALGRMAGISLTAMMVLVALFAYDPIRRLQARAFSATMVAYLIPQAIPIAAPIGLAVGILYASRGSALSRRAVAVGVVVAVGVSVGSFVLIGEIIPSSNQAFRVAAFRKLNPTAAASVEPTRGTPELTFAELHESVESVRRRGVTEPEATMLALYYYQRRALAFAALPMAVFALVVGTRRRYGAVALAAAGIGATALYYVLMGASGRLASLRTIPSLAVWLPHLGVLTLSALLGFRSRRPASLQPEAPL